MADMYPFDTSWQFAQDRGMWPVEQATGEVSRVVIAACPLGMGTHELFPVDSPLWSRIARRLSHFRLADLDRPLDQVVPAHDAVFGVAKPDHRIQTLRRWPALRAALLARHGEGPVTVAVYRCAPFLIPTAAVLGQEVGVSEPTLTRQPTSA